ncbi:hypothetical protein DL95DRAFT_296417 [Leptodontidium sp. 2 PMI_412]|nr:hypothetical protein DL95DRAFT_296417 [Leptodontidium sp. 2 PMI_412]
MPDIDLRLLVLDSGRVRGLSVLIIIQRLIETINLGSPPKLYDCFNKIRETSTGGWVIAAYVNFRHAY